MLEHPGGPAHKEKLMDTAIVAETLSERLVPSYLEGAESGMVEVRGYGLTATEREEAELTAHALYSETE